MTAAPSPARFATTLKWSQRFLAISLWGSCLLFGVYIAFFYVGAYLTDEMARWNMVLPDLYQPDAPVGSFAIAVHFLCGALILMLGATQLIGGIRKYWPRFHRHVGRIYIGASLITALGGLAYIFWVGTVGGLAMDIGFGLYGLLMFAAAIQAFRFARMRDFDRHQLWAWRLFALAIASWLYRMEYGFWLSLFGQAGHTSTFDGPFDQVMAFFFYVPNLLIVEVLYRTRQASVLPPVRVLASASLVVVALLLGYATYQFARRLWIPGINLA